MTLGRQLIFTSLLILMILFTGMIVFVVKNTEVFLNQQLASHSQDTATALGLTLTKTIKINDLVTASRMVDAVWDRGYYRSIVIEKEDGTPIVERHEKIKVYGVPTWFIDYFQLNTPPKEALILDGWKKVGKVKIESNPGFAYQQIWKTFVDSLEWFFVTAIIAIILGGVLLYIILQPLRRITAQATAICNQEFYIQESLPLTIDLRLVVEAMNNMSRRLKHLFEEQSATCERLREQAYKDPVTKLGNRRYFDMQIDYLLQDKIREVGGALILIELKAFKEYNDKYGYDEGDQLLRHVALVIKEKCQAYDDAIISHIKGANLAVILPNKTKEIATKIASGIGQAFSDFYSKNLSKEAEVGHLGVILFAPGENKKELMAHADMALRNAQTQGPNRWYCSEQLPTTQIHGAQEWSEIFAKVIQEKNILLHFQEIQLFDSSDQKIYETLLRLKLDEQTIVPAGIFMPMAERLSQMLALDKLVVEEVVERIKQTDDNAKYSINLSPSAIEDENFKVWLLQKLKSLGKRAKRLIVELPEYGVINRVEQVREFFLRFSQLGGRTAIDHYGKNFSSFSYLYNMKLSYLKIDGGFIRNVQEKDENQFFIHALVDIAHSLGIQVIAEAVETEVEYNTLKHLQVDGAQGYYIARPTEIARI